MDGRRCESSGWHCGPEQCRWHGDPRRQPGIIALYYQCISAGIGRLAALGTRTSPACPAQRYSTHTRVVGATTPDQTQLSEQRIPCGVELSNPNIFSKCCDHSLSWILIDQKPPTSGLFTVQLFRCASISRSGSVTHSVTHSLTHSRYEILQ